MSIVDRARKVLADLWTKRTEDKHRVLEEFIKQELKPELFEHRIEIKDLAEIHCRAIDIGKDLNYAYEINGRRIHSDSSLFQALCYAEAMVGYFRAKGIILHEVKFGDQKDENKRGQN